MIPSIFVGLVGGVLFICIKNLALFVLGFMAGLIIALMFSGIINSYVDASTADEAWFKTVMWTGAIVLGIICGIIVFMIKKYLIILLTSILGSYLFIASIDYLIGDGQFSDVIRNAVEGVQNEMDSKIVIIMFFGWGVLAFLGAVIQYVFSAETKRNTRSAERIIIVNP